MLQHIFSSFSRLIVFQGVYTLIIDKIQKGVGDYSVGRAKDTSTGGRDTALAVNYFSFLKEVY